MVSFFKKIYNIYNRYKVTVILYIKKKNWDFYQYDLFGFKVILMKDKDYLYLYFIFYNFQQNICTNISM